MKFEEGDFVELGRIIAQKAHDGAFVMAKADSTGLLKKIDTKKGTVTIQYDISPVPLKSFIDGKVGKVTEGISAEITGTGTILYGMIGFGGEACGKLKFLADTVGLNDFCQDKIIAVAGPIDKDFLQKAARIGVEGIVAPSVPNADWVNFYGEEIGVALTGDEDIPFTLILTQGFGNGKFEMNADYRKFFAEVEGKTASISGRTQIRAGVTRPMVIVSD